MHTMIEPEGQKMSKFCIPYAIDCWKMHFQCILMYLVEAKLKSDLRMKHVFQMGKT